MAQLKITNKRRMFIFLDIAVTCIVGSMLTTALTTALPSIIKDMGISVATGQWLTSGYSLVMAIIMPLTAFLLARFPTKRLYCTAVFVFTAGLITSAAAGNFAVLMLGRILQAAGNGMLVAMGQVIILTIFPPEKRGTAMGWYGLAIGAAPVIAPTIAALMVDTIGWRMIFVTTFVIMAAAFIFAIIVFADVLENTKKKFDILSFVISAFAFGGITLGIGNIGNYGFISAQTLLPLVVGVVAAVLFVRRQLRIEVPFLEIRTFKSRNYSVSVLSSIVLYFIMMGSSIIMPLYVQQTLGRSATTSAMVMLPGAIAMAIVSPLAGKIYDKVGMKFLFILGSVCLAIGSLPMCFVKMDTALWVASVFSLVRNVAIGCLMMPLTTWGVGSVEAEKTSDATALINSLRTIGGAIGSAVFVTIMTMVTERSAQTYGENASIHGVNMTFLTMTLTSVILLAFAVFGTKEKKTGKACGKQEQK